MKYFRAIGIYKLRREDTIAAPPTRPPMTYRASGVDIDAGNALVETIKPLARSTARRGADATLGGFGGLFDLKPLASTTLYSSLQQTVSAPN